MEGGLQVAYCPTCTFPFEFCSFSGKACAAAASAGAAPAGAGVDAATAALAKASLGSAGEPAAGSAGGGAAPAAAGGGGGGGGGGEGGAASAAPAAPAPAPAKGKGKGSAAAAGPRVGVEVREQGKRRKITTVTGLEGFGVKLKDAASALGKKFGAGASVGKTATGAACVDVQGDVGYDLPAALAALFAVPVAACDVKLLDE